MLVSDYCVFNCNFKAIVCLDNDFILVPYKKSYIWLYLQMEKDHKYKENSSVTQL